MKLSNTETINSLSLVIESTLPHNELVAYLEGVVIWALDYSASNSFPLVVNEVQTQTTNTTITATCLFETDCDKLSNAVGFNVANINLQEFFEHDMVSFTTSKPTETIKNKISKIKIASKTEMFMVRFN